MINSKRIVIFGFGKEGLSAADYLGEANEITIVDKLSKKELAQEFLKKLNAKNWRFYRESELPNNSRFDLIVRSPGVRPDHPLIVQIKKNAAILTSATKIFFDECPAQIIGVTGTKGKGTTTTLIYQLLKTTYKRVHIGGNIGTPALEILPKIKKDDLVVLELSSFQLIDLKKSPHISVVLMITSEHLDWHSDEIEYIRSKESIVKFQTKTDFAVINQDYPKSVSFAKKTKAKTFFVSLNKKTNGVYLEKGKIISQIGNHDEIIRANNIPLPGKHNFQNVLAAVSVAKIYGVENSKIVKTLKTFKGLIHRLQLLGEIKGVKFYNDSYSTIPETTIAAIDAINSPKILILGGSSKKSDFTALAQTIIKSKSVKAILLVGPEGQRIKESIFQMGKFNGKIIEGAKNMKQIVNLSFKSSNPGDAIILSPACASFDMFKNYEDRGRQFIYEVNKLISQTQ